MLFVSYLLSLMPLKTDNLMNKHNTVLLVVLTLVNSCGIV